MESKTAVDALSALAQPTRLEAFRLLVRQEPGSLAAGEIAERLGVPHNTLSTHLAILARAALVGSTRRGRTILYRANLPGFRALVLYLFRDCCEGKPDFCAPLLEDLVRCGQPHGAPSV